MRRRYHITREGPSRPSDEQIARHRDGKGLFYNYHRALRGMHRRPLYRDPKSFLALLLIILLAILLSEASKKRDGQDAPEAPAAGAEP